MSVDTESPFGVSSVLTLGDDQVWRSSERTPFDYSDGAPTEAYLASVLSRVSDLGTMSDELELAIKDWPTEYHLTKRRAHLLRDFSFPRDATALEIGSGCGAITRFLGETFDRVVSIEGASARARLARLRTRGLDNVSIVCAPFESVELERRFDFVFCIGVLEYAQIFSSDGDQAHSALLGRFRSVLKPGGVLVLAIENQFGLKYFASSTEDHTHRMFDGIEGYPGSGPSPRTFGREELEREIGRHFTTTEFYFPLPDYKIPTCVVSERMASKVDLGELFGQHLSKDYLHSVSPLFDERLACEEIGRNKALPMFANSFLVMAGVDSLSRLPTMDGVGVLYRTERAKGLRTRTHFRDTPDGVISEKEAIEPAADDRDSAKLHWVATNDLWMNGPSIQSQAYRIAQGSTATLESACRPGRAWFDELVTRASGAGALRSVDGMLLDATWKNAFVNEGVVEFIDLEWQSDDPLRLNTVLTRALYVFLADFRYSQRVPRFLTRHKVADLIRAGAKSYGVMLGEDDFEIFIQLESTLQSLMTGLEVSHTARVIRARLASSPGPTTRVRIERFRGTAIARLRRAVKPAKAAVRKALRRV